MQYELQQNPLLKPLSNYQNFMNGSSNMYIKSESILF